MTLKKYLEDLGIDNITDDEKFMYEEYEAVRDYCKELNYKISDEDIKTLKSRGLYDSFLDWQNY